MTSIRIETATNSRPVRAAAAPPATTANVLHSSKQNRLRHHDAGPGKRDYGPVDDQSALQRGPEGSHHTNLHNRFCRRSRTRGCAPEARTSGGYWYHQRCSEPAASVRDERFQDELLDDLARFTGTRLA